jgi:N-acetyl-alpha-D-glucosaminyl L-malate synthase BshA
MKIGIVCYPTLGGSGVVATELGHALASSGHQVHFITYEVPFRLRIDEKNIFFHQVEINRYDLFKYPDYALPLAVKMACVSEEFDLDVLHVHYAIPHATSAFLAKQILGKKKPVVITTLHGTDITLVGRDPGYYQIVKHSIENSDGVTAVSENLQEQTVDHFKIEKPIEVIYNFFTPRRDILGKKPLRSAFVKNDEKLLIHSSNFRSVKRPGDVVGIFLEVRKHLKCKLLFLGTGAGIEEIREMVHENNVEKEVFFLGESRKIDKFVASADLYLLPSAQESFGLSALEAMAYGVPVISTKVGGIPEVVIDGETGYLSCPGDIKDMSKNAIKLLTNPELHQKMGCAAQKRAHESFSVSKILPQYLDYYTKTIESTCTSN